MFPNFDGAIFAPGGLGVREAAMAVMLLPFVSVETAAVFVVLSRLLVTAAQGTATLVSVVWVHLEEQIPSVTKSGCPC